MKTPAPQSVIRFGCLVSLALASGSEAATLVKTNNTDNLNLASSWTNNAVPGTADVALWDSTVAAGNTTNALGASLSWSGIRIVNPGAPVTIITNTGATTLTIGAAGIDMSGASQSLTLSNVTAVLGGTAQTWAIGSGASLWLGNTFTRNAQATVVFDTSAGGTINSALSTASSVLSYSTLNKTDFGALDASRNITGAASVITYTPNPTGTGANTANLAAGTYTWIDVVNSNPAIAPSALRCSGNVTTSGIRFNTPNSNGIDWVVDVNSRNFGSGSFAILVTPNAGSKNVQFNTSTGNLRLGTGSELIFAQHNTSGDLVINGQITQAGAGSFVTKTGAGRAILNSAFNGYTGGTFIEQGTVLVNGLGVITNSASTVNSGAVLGGSGTVGSVTVASGGSLAPGGDGVGTLTVRGALTFNAGTTFLNCYAPAVPTTNTTALLSLSNNLTVSGTVNVAIKSGNASVGQYPLIRWTNAIPGGVFSAFNLAATPPHLLAYLSNNTANSTIDLVVTNVNEPLKWAAASATWDIAATPNWQDTFGASTTYQEANGTGDSVVFEDTVSVGNPITVTLNTNPIPGSVTVSAAKNYTISGSGSIQGSGALTKAGSGTLTLSTANSFSGGLSINNGILSFSALTNLGAGAISFGGGTLQYNGNSDDISVRTVTLNAGGGSIDTAGNTVNFASPIGNNGAGGLTKLGSGTLTLNGTNRYAGITLVNQGTLALGGSSYFSNSAAIMIAGGALLDTASSGVGLTLRSTVNQILGGSGTVGGVVNAPASTTITPATNGTTGTLTINGDLQMSGGTIVYDVSTTTRDLIVAGNLTLSSGFLQVAASEALTNGVYKVIQYSGALNGLAANIQLTGFSQANKTASLSDATPNEIDLIIGNGRGTNLVWQGDGVNNYWNELGEFNWTNGTGTPMQFISLDKVTFDDTSANLTVNLTNVLQPGAVTVNASANYTFQDSGTGAGKISGATGLTKSGSGTLTILTPNNNVGPTVVNGGTLQVGNGSVTGDIGTGNVTNNSAVVFAQTDDRSVAGTISGIGTLTQQGSARLILAQNNTYSGGTTISSGALQVGNGGGTGSLGSSPVVDNSTLSFNRSGTHSLTNAISGSGLLIKSGSATMTLQGNFTYQGNTYLSNGIAKLGAPEQIPDGLNVAGSTGWLILDGSDTAAGVFDLNSFNETVNALSGLFGAALGVITNSAGGAGTNTLTVLGSAGTTFNGLITENSAGTKVSLVLRGASELRLNGANTYTGGTYVGDTATIGVGPGGSIGAATSRLVLSNGTTLLIHNNGGTGGFAGNAVTIPDNSQATFNSTQLGNGFSGTVAGSATTTNLIAGPVSFSANGLMQHQPFNGVVLVQAGAELRFSGSTTLTEGGTNATYDVEGTMHVRNNGTVTLGALTGSGFINAPTVTGTGTWIVGTKGVDTTYAGEFSGANNLTKSGPGRLTLSGNVSHTGNTTVSNGVLVLATDTAVLDSCPTISVKTGAFLDVSARTDGTLNLGNSVAQTLSGAGTIQGNLNAGANSLVSPGDSIGTLTVTNSVTLAGTNIMELNRTNTPVNCDRIVSPSITASGMLTVSNIGPALQGGDSFQLYSTPISGAFALTNLPALTGNLYWTNTLAVNGRIAVVNPVNTAPPFITNAVSGNALSLTWPADHTGWQLQTNSVGLGSPSQWFNVPGSSATNQIIITIDPGTPKTFFRLIYP